MTTLHHSVWSRGVFSSSLTHFLIHLAIALTFTVLTLAILWPNQVMADNSEELKWIRKEIKKIKHQSAKRIKKLEERLQRAEAMNERAKGLPSATQQSSTMTTTSTTDAATKREGTTKKEKVVKEAPKSKSARAVYQDKHVLFERKFSLETGFTYSRFDRKQLVLNGFLALDSIFLGNISVDDVEADIFTVDVVARWGIGPRTQIDLQVPLVYRTTLYSSGMVGEGTLISGAMEAAKNQGCLRTLRHRLTSAA